MPGAEISNVRSNFINGALRFQRVSTNEDLFVIGATTGVPFGAQNQQVVNITAATTLNPSTHAGAIVYNTTDAIVCTLPACGPSTAGIIYTVMNTASDGGAITCVKSAGATDWINGAGTAAATTNLAINNTKATHKYGDMISLTCNGSTAWFVIARVGTWSIATTT